MERWDISILNAMSKVSTSATIVTRWGIAKDCSKNPKTTKDKTQLSTTGTGMFVGAMEHCASTGKKKNSSYLLDLGASTHVVFSNKGVYDATPSDKSIQVGR